MYYNEIVCILRYVVYIHILSLNHKYHKYMICFSYSTCFHTIFFLSNIYIYMV